MGSGDPCWVTPLGELNPPILFFFLKKKKIGHFETFNY
jgi:hypothetical protein